MAYDISAWNKPAGPATSKTSTGGRCACCLIGRRRWCARLRPPRVPIHEIFGKSKAHAFAIARREAIYRVKFEKPSVSSGSSGFVQWTTRSIIFAIAASRSIRRTGPDSAGVRQERSMTRFHHRGRRHPSRQLDWSNDYGWGDRTGRRCSRPKNGQARTCRLVVAGWSSTIAARGV